MEKKNNAIKFVLDKDIASGKMSDQEAKERLAVLSENYDKWLNSQPEKYKYKYMFLCNGNLATINLPDRIVPTVTVEKDHNGIRITGFDGQRNTRLEESNKNGDPIEEMFVALKNHVRAEKYVVRFDPIYGYLREVLVIPDKEGFDNSFYIEVFSFERIHPK